jgi:hypothetical protein
MGISHFVNCFYVIQFPVCVSGQEERGGDDGNSEEENLRVPGQHTHPQTPLRAQQV